MRKTILHITCGLLLATGWANALAQGTTSPAQRLNLELVDNVSNYNIATQQNEYTNTLQFALGSGNQKVTASMLNEGDNYLTFHRLDNMGGDEEFARLNLKTDIDGQKVCALNFGDYTAPSSDEPITDLPEGWTVDANNVILQPNGSGYLPAGTILSLTVPEGFDNDVILITIQIGSNNRDGYIGIAQNTTDSWSMNQTYAGSPLNYAVSGVSAGDVFNFVGIELYSGTYYSADSPDITSITVRNDKLIPDITVTPMISYKDGENWGAETNLPNSTATTYAVEDAVNLSGQVADEFSVEITTDNDHPDSYSYKADLDANVMFPSSDIGGDNFYAKVDFSGCTSTAAESATFTGPNNWNFFGTFSYHPSGYNWCGYIMSYGAFTYTMPSSFYGNSVTVTVTSNTDDDGAGHLVVNGEDYQFTAGETHSWTVPVTTNGIIEFKPLEGETYSIDIASIVITSGNGSSLNAPRHASDNQAKSMAPSNSANNHRMNVKNEEVLFKISKK